MAFYLFNYIPFLISNLITTPFLSPSDVLTNKLEFPANDLTILELLFLFQFNFYSLRSIE